MRVTFLEMITLKENASKGIIVDDERVLACGNMLPGVKPCRCLLLLAFNKSSKEERRTPQPIS